MFEILLVKPILNLLILIYALIPGHNFGLAIILFTLVVRFLMWPLVKKQLHQSKVMREMQPELKRIKKAAKGNRQQESMMMMELYRERGVSPFSTIGTMIVQLIIVIALYSGLSRIVRDPGAILDHAYGWVRDLGWLQHLAGDISQFSQDNNLFGVVDLSRSALPKDGSGVYWPAMLLVIGSAASQYFLSKQLLPRDKEARSLRQILREAGQGKQADAAETNAAVGRGMIYFIPALIFLFTVGLPAALSLYWMTGGIIAYFQQAAVLNKDKQELKEVADTASKKDIIEGEVLASKPKTTTKKKKASAKSKRRK